MSLPRPESDDFFNLLFDLREGRLDAARWEELTALLEQDESARRRYLEVMQLCAELKWRNLSPSKVLPSPERPASPPPTPWSGAVRFLNQPAVFSAISAIATVAAGLTLLALVNRPAPPSVSSTAVPHHQVATLVGVVDAQWGGPRSAPRGRVLAGRWELEAGVCELRLDNGVALIVEGPADFDLQTVKQIRLDHGRLAVRVPPAAHGFRVLTPQAELIDLGTEFGVVVDSSQTTDVVVYQGRVEVHSLSDPRAKQRLVAEPQQPATATRVDAQGIAPLAAPPDGMLRTLPPPGKFEWAAEQVTRTTRDGAGADAYVQGSHGQRKFADWGYGGEPVMWLKTQSKDLSYTRLIYLRFDLTDLRRTQMQQAQLTLTSMYDVVNEPGAWRLQIFGWIEPADAPFWLEGAGPAGPAADGVLCWNRAPGLDKQKGTALGPSLRLLAEIPLPGRLARGAQLTVDLSDAAHLPAWEELIQARQGRTVTLIVQAVRVGSPPNEKLGWNFCSKENSASDSQPPTLTLMGVTRRERETPISHEADAAPNDREPEPVVQPF